MINITTKYLAGKASSAKLQGKIIVKKFVNIRETIAKTLFDFISGLINL